jgi:enoyl-CoA hydratase/carnithine racemase
MRFETLDFEQSGGTAIARFNRPDDLNSLTESVFDDLEALITHCETDPTVRALVLTGKGKAFCVGLDLALLGQAFDDIGYFSAVVHRLAGIVSRLEQLPIPTLAAVNGYARAGGFEIAMGCDFVTIGSKARIGDAHTDSGVLPATVTARLARRIGMQRAKELLWTARWLEPQEAVDYGLALRVFPQETLVDDSVALLGGMINKPAPALAALKASLQATAEMGVEEATAHELAVFVEYATTQPYGKEGYTAFLEKRPPRW